MGMSSGSDKSDEHIESSQSPWHVAPFCKLSNHFVLPQKAQRCGVDLYPPSFHTVQAGMPAKMKLRDSSHKNRIVLFVIDSQYHEHASLKSLDLQMPLSQWRGLQLRAFHHANHGLTTEEKPELSQQMQMIFEKLPRGVSQLKGLSQLSWKHCRPKCGLISLSSRTEATGQHLFSNHCFDRL